MKFNELEVGDVCYAHPHLIVEKTEPNGVVFRNHITGDIIYQEWDVAEKLFLCANQYTEERTVTKEDSKKTGPGIRSIWENIPRLTPFQVIYKTEFNAQEIKKQKEEFTSAVLKAQRQKKGVTEIAIDLFNEAISKLEGKTRLLTGYKLENYSRTGKYMVYEIGADPNNPIRTVNINTISTLVYEEVKYNVKT